MKTQEDTSGRTGIPELFRPAFEVRDESLAVLGEPTGSDGPFFGFGEEDRALPMERGLLVFRRRIQRYSAIPAETERENPVDMSSTPEIGSLELPDVWNIPDGAARIDALLEHADRPGDGRNPLVAEEENRFKKLVSERAALAPLLAELDWYRNNSAELFEARRRDLVSQLAKQTGELDVAEKKLAESRESRSRTTGLLGTLKNAATSLGFGWLEGQVARAERRVAETREALAANAGEAERYDRFPFLDAIDRLVEAEAAFLGSYKEYCRIRHFRKRFETDILQNRALREEQARRIAELRSKIAETETEIRCLETRLPELRGELAAELDSLHCQEAGLRETEVADKARKEAFRNSFEALVGASPPWHDDNGADAGLEPAEGMVSFRCPKCGGMIAVQEDSDAYLAECPTCGETIDLTEIEPVET